MKSKSPRKICWTNPKLRAIRINLRKLVKHAVNSRVRALQHQSSLYMEKISKGQSLTSSQEKRWYSLGKKSKTLMHSLRRSVCMCYRSAGCLSYKEAIKHGLDPKDRPLDMDMVWIPENYQSFRRKGMWMCVKCFERYNNSLRKTIDRAEVA